MRPVVELTPRLEEIETREFDPGQRERYERHLGEILSALGMDLHTPGTRDTPRRLLQALIDSTAGYDGDEKLLTAFPSERPAGVNGCVSPYPIVASVITVIYKPSNHDQPSSAR